MFSLQEMPSITTALTAYASIGGSIMFARSLINKFIPPQLQSYIYLKLLNMLGLDSASLTFVIDEFNGLTRNQVYEAAESILSTKITPSMRRLQVSQASRDKQLSVTVTTGKGEAITDIFEGVQLTWKLVCSETEKSSSDIHPYGTGKKSYELSFHEKHKEMVQECYLPYILSKYKELKEEDNVVKLYSCGGGLYGGHDQKLGGGRGSGVWGSIKLEHPSTFDTLAMEPELKKEIIEDLERFVKRKEFYKKVGKVWKRGYLLYGPPGTGKSSLIAAMANYLKFDVYDMELANLESNHCLRNMLVSTKNRSIIVIEDIDCSVHLPDRNVSPYHKKKDPKVTLSGLLNFIDGLWSSCGDERIIVFTTNHKDKLDPALLRPGRMDMHIHMSYCTPKSFRLLASNYLSINTHHRLFGEIEELIQEIEITPAEVAGELMKSDDADISLDGLIKFIKRKKMEDNEKKDELGDKETTHQESSEQQDYETDTEEENSKTMRLIQRMRSCKT